MAWKGRSDELEYKVKLVKEYQDLKKSGLTDKRITQLFPEMKEVVTAFKEDNDESSDSDDGKDKKQRAIVTHGTPKESEEDDNDSSSESSGGNVA